MYTETCYISGSKQDFLRICTEIKNSEIKELYKNSGGEIKVSAEIKENKLTSKIIEIIPNETDPLDGQYGTTNQHTVKKYGKKNAMLKIDLPTDRQETKTITNGEKITLDYQIILRGPIVSTQTNWNNTGETNIFIVENEETKDQNESGDEVEENENNYATAGASNEPEIKNQNRRKQEKIPNSH